MTHTLRIAILDDYQDVATDYADWHDLPGGAEVTVFTRHLPGTEAVVEALRPFDVVVAMRERTRFDEAVLGSLPNLRLLVTTGRANAAIDVAAATRHGILVSSGATGGSTGAAEVTWALILAALRHLPHEDAAVRSGDWQSTVGGDLEGRRLGLLGLGAVGSRVARVGVAFGMDVVAWTPRLDAERAHSFGVSVVSKEELLATSDVVSLHARLTAESRGLIGARELASMRSSAVLVNTSRGPLVDEPALLGALHRGTIGGAALDVYDEEPLPLDSPWRAAPRTVLSPHLGYVTEGTLRRFYTEAHESVHAWAEGAPIRVLGRS
ncbi:MULTISPECIES: D-2-hydroxyacid dehydrogenase family protein [unclassified Rathayibacter]|uniref:D-2-hydroxyacid dehydrogenase family protein n=1 Tax=unclassified Rathayibacter TaxID=2609250 RepID=UPI00188D5FB1|nr:MULTISPECIES: D-2-hydroxyacid dehydrogenase family protein [unclassified Rathayibacter]MBF4461135.1 D-2-hydroxyacid dehydrogenase family protein [Rathayibacter sp. VKM Ac-2879]MBF4502546.1 D-2-hydroxyacid dehydrogenase family protein [Rathayibacter sp. VKM Ac-2878]